METKGAVVASLPEFVKTTFGEEGYHKWMEALPQSTREAFSERILSGNWYPVSEMLVTPTQVACDLFYEGDVKGAWESGRFSADKGLRGIYRVFVAVASPSIVIKKCAVILPTFYKPSNIEAMDFEGKSASLRITEFPEPHPILDARIGGWIQRGLEICGCKNPVIKSRELMCKGDPYTTLLLSWD